MCEEGENPCGHEVGTLLHLWFVDAGTSHFQRDRDKQELLHLADETAALHGNNPLTQQFSCESEE